MQLKVGDLVKTTGFGPKGTTGEIGIIIKDHPYFPRTFIVLFNCGVRTPYAQDGMEVLSESR